MEVIKIEETSDTPKVVLDIENKKFKFSGISMPENTLSFYVPIIDWINENMYQIVGKYKVEFKFKYINTSSHKMILEILLIIDENFQNGKEVSVVWCSDKEDEDMLSTGEEFSEIVGVPFEFCVLD